MVRGAEYNVVFRLMRLGYQYHEGHRGEEFFVPGRVSIRLRDSRYIRANPDGLFV